MAQRQLMFRVLVNLLMSGRCSSLLIDTKSASRQLIITRAIVNVVGELKCKIRVFLFISFVITSSMFFLPPCIFKGDVFPSRLI